MRTIGYGAAAIPEPLLRRVLAETSVGLSQGYGATELSGNACFLDAADHRARSRRPARAPPIGRPAGARASSSGSPPTARSSSGRRR